MRCPDDNFVISVVRTGYAYCCRGGPNVENNSQLLEASITLAQAHGVSRRDKSIKNADDLDAFMMA
ncbi:hypothetical protein B6N31_03480 [Dickeya fangzhongdai]|nr:hypothetical protein B6N31_03480 [Dickeya fangzhongdai]